jgi:hypothetical protein
MLRHPINIHYAALVAALSAVSIIPALRAQTPAHNHAIVEWYADLSPAKSPKNPSQGMQARLVQTPSTGTVTTSFDFDHRTVTFHVEAKDIPGVRTIEVRTVRSHGELGGPTIFTLYDSHDGPFSGTLTKSVTGQSFTQVATPILNGQAAVVVTTEANPDGEIAGMIAMHKRYEK